MSAQNRRALRMLFVIFFVGICAPYQTINSQETKAQAVLGELSKKYTVKKLNTDKSGIPTYIDGDLTPSGAQGDELNISYMFFEENKDIFQMNNPRQELIVRKIEKDELGMTHVALKQTYLGVEVYGGEFVVHFSLNKQIRSTNGFYKRGIKISTVPTISQQTAADIALLDLEHSYGKGNMTDNRLMIYEHKGTYHLIWKVMVRIESPPGNWEYFIDAHSGELLFKANRITFYRVP